MRRSGIIGVRAAGLQRHGPDLPSRLQTTDAAGKATFKDDLPRLVSGARDAHPRPGLRQRFGGKDDADRVSGRCDLIRLSHGVYAAKGRARRANGSDMVFADGSQAEMAALSGDTSSGYTATLTIGVAV